MILEGINPEFDLGLLINKLLSMYSDVMLLCNDHLGCFRTPKRTLNRDCFSNRQFLVCCMQTGIPPGTPAGIPAADRLRSGWPFGPHYDVCFSSGFVILIDLRHVNIFHIYCSSKSVN